METKANYVIVGAGLIVFLAALTGFIVWIAGFRTDRVEYRVLFDQSVAGLSEGSVVRFKGVQVGTVQEIRLQEEAPVDVVVRIAVAPDTPIRADSTATIKSAGLTGSSYVAISAGSPDAERLQPADGEAPVIPAEKSGISELLQAAPEALENVEDLVARLTDLVEENREGLHAIVADVRATTDVVAAHRDDLARVFEDTAAASESLRRTAERAEELVDKAVNVVDALEAEVPPTVRQVRSAAASVRRAAGEAEELVAETRPSVRQFTRDGLLEVRHFINEARLLVDEMQRAVQEFRRNPVDALFDGDDARFRPRDR